MKNPSFYKEHQRGQAIVLIAALMVALIAALGLAIDGGGMFLLYRDVQNATDAAGLSAAYSICTGGDPELAVNESAELNGFVDGVNGVSITVQYPPGNLLDAGSPYIGQTGYIAIEIKAVKPSYFIQVVYDGPLEVSAVTVSQCQNADDFGLLPNAALITLRSTCQNPQDAGITSTGGSATVVMGSVYSNVIPSCTGFRKEGNSSFIVQGGLICSDGAIDSGATDLFGDPATTQQPCNDSAPVSNDPLHLSGNEPQCDRSIDLAPLSQYYEPSNGPAPAGYYSSMTTGPNTNVILSPGIYCTGQSIDFKGTVESAPGGVTIFMDCGTCTFDTNANANIKLQASQSGKYAGLLFYTNSTNTQNGNKFNGSSDMVLTGTVYAPTSRCSVKGGNDTIIYAQFICWEYHAAGNQELTIWYDPAVVYKVPPTFGITE